jgi:hypothetical protein
VGLAFATGLTAIADGDIFWHLAAGRHMVQTGRLLRADPFSVSALGRPWIDVHWLFQLASYGVYRAGGYLGLVLAKAALVAAGTVVLDRVVAREAPRWAFPLPFVTALFLARHLLPVRPIVLTLLFLALFFAILEAFRREGKPRILLWLPLLQIAWVNFQGLAAFGPALVAAYLAGALATTLVGERRWFPFQPETAPWRPLALAVAGCAAASFVSPFGARAALLPFKLLLRITPAGANVFASEVAENIPPFVLERTAPEQIGHFKWYLAALALTFALARGRLLLSRLLVVAALVTLALMANRNVLLLYWLGTPIAVMNAAPALRRLLTLRRASAVAGVIGGLAFAAVGALVVVAAAREPSLRAPTPFRFPTESARALAYSAGGTVFAPDHQGGYLIWTLHPRHRPYLDTRLILRTAAEFAEYLDVVDHPERFDAFQARHRFDHVVLPTGYPDRYLGLVAHLHRSRDWRLIFTDGSEVLFAREPGPPEVDLAARETTLRLLDDLSRRFTGPLLTAARLHLAKLELLVGEIDEAKLVLAPMDDLGARALRARCFLLAGDLTTAETLARSLLAEDPGDVQSMNLLAVIALARGDGAAGLGWLRQALERDPFNAESRSLLERLEKR